MMRVMSSTPSPAVAGPDWAHTYFGAFLYYFLELLGGSRFPQGGTKSKRGRTLLKVANLGESHNIKYDVT